MRNDYLDRALVVADYNSGQVAALPILADGTLGPVSDVATLPGEPLYAALGFKVLERLTVRLAGDVEVPLVRMQRRIDS